MVKRMNATEVKARLLALLTMVAEGDEVEITRHGRTIARLVPARSAHALRGSFSGVAMTATAEDEDLFGTGIAWNLP